MRIGIDAREIQNGVTTGIGRPLANFLHYFAKLNTEDVCVLFSSQKIPADFGPRVSNRVIQEAVTFFWDQWQLPQGLKKEKIDLFYSPYYKIPLLKPCTTANAILDLMYLAFPPYRKRMPLFKKLYYASFGKAYAHQADKILTCSEYSKKEIERIYGVPSGKIQIIPLSVGDLYRPTQAPSPVQGRYILYVGNFKEHKNVRTLIEAFALITWEFQDLKLILAGPKEHSFAELMEAAHELKLDSKVRFLGTLTEADHPEALYSHAEVFVMPSLYEGFGLPPLEAMACGVPVVASHATSVPEVVKDAGLLVDSRNVQAMAEAIRKILKDEILKKRLVDKGLEYAKDYASDKISKQLYDVLKTIWTKNNGGGCT